MINKWQFCLAKLVQCASYARTAFFRKIDVKYARHDELCQKLYEHNLSKPRHTHPSRNSHKGTMHDELLTVTFSQRGLDFTILDLEQGIHIRGNGKGTFHTMTGSSRSQLVHLSLMLPNLTYQPLSKWWPFHYMHENLQTVSYVPKI